MQHTDPSKIEAPLLSSGDTAEKNTEAVDKIALIKKKREEYYTAKSQPLTLNIPKGLNTVR